MEIAIQVFAVSLMTIIFVIAFAGVVVPVLPGPPIAALALLVYKLVFPEEGEKKDGIIEENGSLYYYVDGVLTGAGLIRIDGDYYYVKTSTGEVVHGRSYWITATNGLLPSEEYTFADDGKMVNPPDPDQPSTEEKNGIVEENGSLYYYVDGVLTGAGLIQIDGNYYYVRTSTGEVVHGRTYWITATNGLPVPVAQYEFADDGKLILE